MPPVGVPYPPRRRRPSGVVGNIVGGVVSPPAVGAVGNVVGNTIGPAPAASAVGGIVGSSLQAATPPRVGGRGVEALGQLLVHSIQQRQAQQAMRVATKDFSPAQQALVRPVLAASKQTGVSPALLMGVLGQESNYGTNTGPSTAGARGVGQFIPETRQYMIQKYGVDPWADADQGVLASALYLKELGVNKNPQAALSHYSGGYAAGDYNNPILARAQQFGALDKLADVKGTGSGAYVSPFQNAAYQQSRTDEGVDYTGQGQINAIGRARYLGQGQAWGPEAGGGGSGYGLLYQLLKGRHAGENVFTYEGIAPAGPELQVGDVIKKGQPVAQFVPGGSIETGYADRSGAPLSQPYYNEGDVTDQGVRFQRLLSRVGAASRPGQPGLSGGVAAGGGAAYGPGGTVTAFGSGGTGGAPAGPAAQQRGGGSGLRSPLAPAVPKPGQGPTPPTESPISDLLAARQRQRQADITDTLDLIASLG